MSLMYQMARLALIDNAMMRSKATVVPFNITRNSIAVYPLNSYNYMGGYTYNANKPVVFNSNRNSLNANPKGVSVSVENGLIKTTYNPDDAIPSDASVGNSPAVIQQIGDIFIGGDTHSFVSDFGNKIAGDSSTHPLELYQASIDPATPPTPTVSFRNEVAYNPLTWAEWSKNGVVCNSTGIEFIADGSNVISAIIPLNVKPSTNYGFLFNIVSSNIANINNFKIGGGVAYPFNATTLTTSLNQVGNNKIIRASASSFSDNSMMIAYLQEPVGNKIKIKDIRIFELPAGSAIEYAFNNMTADQLAAAFPMPTTYTYKNELIYTPSTWAEWTKPTGVTGDSTGLEFTANGTNYNDAILNCNFKVNTKYLFLYNVVSCTLDSDWRLASGSYSAFGGSNMPKDVGNQKIVLTSNSTITANKLDFYTPSTCTAGTKIKIKNIRVFEVPVGSQIEADANSLAADQLVALYKFNSSGLIQAANPVQTSYGIWAKVTDQKIIDKIKAQNEILISSVNTTGRTAVWNGQTLAQQGDSSPAIRDDLAGKTKEDVTGNPNIAKVDYSSALIAPSSFVSELSQASYNQLISISDGSLCGPTTSINEQIPKLLLSFNAVEIAKRKFGALPTDGSLAADVAWCKANFGRVLCNIWAYGVCPTGNKLVLASCLNTNTWTTERTTTDSVISLATATNSYISGSVASRIFSDGFMHFLVYTDAASVTTPSILLLTGHGLGAWDIIENTTRNIYKIALIKSNDVVTVTSFITGQTSGDVIKKFKIRSTSVLAEAGTTETLLKVTNHGLVGYGFVENGTRGWTAKATVVDANTLQLDMTITGQTQGDSLHLCEYAGTQVAEGQTVPTALMMKNHGLSTSDIIENMSSDGVTQKGISSISNPSANALTTGSITNQQKGDIIRKYKYSKTITAGEGTTETTLVVPNHGLSVGDWIRNNTIGGTRKKVASIVDINTLTIDSAIPGQAAGNSIFTYPLMGTQTAEDIAAPSTIYVDYSNIEIQLKSTVGYDVLVSPTPRRDAGLGNAVLLEKSYAKMTVDYAGKIVGSVVENANIAKVSYDIALIAPSSFSSELSQASYNQLIVLSDGSKCAPATTVNGQIPKILFALNVVADYEKQYGLIPVTITGVPATDLANKIAWLKANVKQFTAKWYGNGSCPSGNKAYFTAYLATSSQWNNSGVKSNTASSPSLLSYGTTSVADYINADGFVYFIAYTDASDGVTTSTIYTDYISLDIEFINQNRAMEYFTGNSAELENIAASKVPAYMVECDLTAICNALYGGSNAAMKTALKAIVTNLYAMGSGSNAGSLGYGCVMKGFADAWLTWKTNYTTSISLLDYSGGNGYLQTNNKLYVLICSKYSSDGTIPSDLSVDFAQIKVDFSRVEDRVSPVPINLPDTWSILGEFSPNWDSNYTPVPSEGKILMLVGSPTNRITLEYTSLKKMRLVYVSGASIYGQINLPEVFNKNQVYRFLACYKPGMLKLYMLKNNGTLSTGFAIPTTPFITGAMSLYVGGLTIAGFNADTIFGFTRLLDGYFPATDADAEAMLRDDDLSPNLIPDFNSSRWIKKVGTSVSNDGKTLTLNTAATYQSSYISIPVLPNNRYLLSLDKSADARISYGENYNSSTVLTNNPTTLDNHIDIITSDKTNALMIYLTNSTPGIFTFSNLSLKLKM